METAVNGYATLIVLLTANLTLSSEIINIRCTLTYIAFYPSNATRAIDVFILYIESASGLALIYDYRINYLLSMLSLTLV
jgi:hypothetical protein